MTDENEAVKADNGKPEDNGAIVRLDRIKAKRYAVTRAQRMVDECTAELNEAKGVLKGATQRLLSEIDDDQLPLEYPAKDPEEWTTESVEILGLPNGITEKLKAAEIETLGQLATHSKTKLLTDIEGIGDSAREKIESALETYWQEQGMTSNVDEEGEPIEAEATPT